MKRRALLLAAALGVLALVGCLLWSERQVRTPPVVVEDPLPSPDPTEQLDVIPGGTATRNRIVADAQDGVRAHLVGRAVGEDGAGLAGLRVVLISHHVDAWSEAVEIGTIKMDDERIPGFETWTDGGGEFAISVPVPTSSNVLLTVEPDEFHVPCSREFGTRLPPLESGSRDLGDLILASAGGLEGQVKREDGTPVEGARVNCQGQSMLADVRGTYRFESILPGSVRVGAHAEGYLWTDVEISVRARDWTKGIDFTLGESPTISGHVTDEKGSPLAGVRIFAMSIRDDLSWEAWHTEGSTDVDGRFSLALKSKKPQDIRFFAPGFEQQSIENVEPGNSDLRVELNRGQAVTLQVVDSQTGEPIERYGLFGEEERSWHGSFPRELAMEDRPGGTASLLLPGISVHVVADGYARRSVDIPLEPPDPFVVTLERGSRIVGRALRGSVPIPRLRVSLLRGSPGAWELLPDGRERQKSFDLSEFEGESREVRTDAEGRFEFGNLPAGTYRLQTADPRYAPVVRDSAVPRAETVDLGDLQLEPGATLRGRILRPPAGSGVAWSVTLDQETYCQVEADYRYQRLGLAPGPYEVFLYGPGMRRPAHMVSIELGAGETRDLDLDIGLLEPARVRVRVTHGGRALAGFEVRVACTDPQDSVEAAETKTDANGYADLIVSPCSSPKWEVKAPSGIRLGFSGAPSSIPAAEFVEAQLQVDAGEIALRFPDEFRFPEGGQVRVRLRPKGKGTQGPSSVTLLPADAALEKNTLHWTEREVALGLVPPGEYVVYAVVRYPKTANEDPDPEGERTYRGRVEVKAGSNSTCAIRQQSR